MENSRKEKVIITSFNMRENCFVNPAYDMYVQSCHSKNFWFVARNYYGKWKRVPVFTYYREEEELIRECKACESFVGFEEISITEALLLCPEIVRHPILASDGRIIREIETKGHPRYVSF